MRKKIQKKPDKKINPAGALIKVKRDPRREKQYLPLSKSTFANYIEDNCICHEIPFDPFPAPSGSSPVYVVLKL
jgi:hypothetical protein